VARLDPKLTKIRYGLLPHFAWHIEWSEETLRVPAQYQICEVFIQGELDMPWIIDNTDYSIGKPIRSGAKTASSRRRKLANGQSCAFLETGTSSQHIPIDLEPTQRGISCVDAYIRVETTGRGIPTSTSESFRFSASEKMARANTISRNACHRLPWVCTRW
jgi:hypothetical protein